MEQYILKTNRDGSVITVRDVQMQLLSMMKDIDALCQKHHIPYVLCGGSCLGAVRHKGFIPWDDDADIAMMYEDYLRFLTVVDELPSIYMHQSFETHREYNVCIPAMKIRKRDTYVREANFLLRNKCKDSDGLFIDVFILDYLSEDFKEDYQARIKARLYLAALVVIDNMGINPVHLKQRFVSFVREYSRKNKGSKWIGYDLTWTFNSCKKPVRYSYESVFPVTYVPFEDTMLPIPNRPKDMLDVEIGTTFMSYPPKKDQKPKHIKDIRL